MEQQKLAQIGIAGSVASVLRLPWLLGGYGGPLRVPLKSSIGFLGF